ncbi:UNVERIFIED_CONTAM: hypothetical protein Sindi_1466900, partial [Sesamum indicum]
MSALTGGKVEQPPHLGGVLSRGDLLIQKRVYLKKERPKRRGERHVIEEKSPKEKLEVEHLEASPKETSFAAWMIVVSRKRRHHLLIVP